jgi:hypothetical protein
MNIASSSSSEHVVIEYGSNKRIYKVSCLHCRSSHRKCDRELPSCSQCIKKGINCCYTPPKKRGRSDGYSWMANNQTIEKSKTIGFNLEDRINSAVWYATRALLFLHAPLVQSHPHHVRVMCDDMSKEIEKVTPAINHGDMFELIHRMSSLELQQSALQMFNKGKEIILNPNIYPHIATDPSLAYACSCLATFLLTGKKQHMTEALLLNSAVKVFVKDTRAVADGDDLAFSSWMNTENRTKMTKYRESVQIVSLGFFAAKLLYFFHTDISKYTMDHLIETFQTLHKSCKYMLNIFPNEDTLQRQLLINLWSSILQIVKESSGLKRTKQLLDALELLVVDLNILQPKEIGVIISRSLQLYSIIVELKNITEQHNEYFELKALQLKYANLITMVATESSLIAELIMNGSYLLLLVCEIHLEHCDKLLENPDIYDQVELSNALTFMQSDVIILNRFQSNDSLSMYDQLLQKFNTRIVSLLTVMQRVYRDKHLQSSSKEENYLSQVINGSIPVEDECNLELLDLEEFL